MTGKLGDLRLGFGKPRIGADGVNPLATGRKRAGQRIPFKLTTPPRARHCQHTLAFELDHQCRSAANAKLYFRGVVKTPGI